MITVLIQGESGTGKEVAARFLHRNSPRKNGPFIALNCGAISKNLVESILEGAKKGAYTGASSDQQGVVRAADGGTLFLDEIGELPLECQSKLLRILQERAVLPVGATRSIPVDFRLVCATNRNLREDVAAGRFRSDLFFRLNVFPVILQPLRERDDFENLAKEIWEECDGHEKVDLSNFELSMLRTFSWPGNIRQLKNVLERYSLLKFHGISLDEILEGEYEELQTNYFGGFCCEKISNEQIEGAIRRCGGNKVRAAKMLGISRSNLYVQMKKNSENLEMAVVKSAWNS